MPIITQLLGPSTECGALAGADFVDEQQCARIALGERSEDGVDPLARDVAVGEINAALSVDTAKALQCALELRRGTVAQALPRFVVVVGVFDARAGKQIAVMRFEIQHGRAEVAKEVRVVRVGVRDRESRIDKRGVDRCALRDLLVEARREQDRVPVRNGELHADGGGDASTYQRRRDAAPRRARVALRRAAGTQHNETRASATKIRGERVRVQEDKRPIVVAIEHDETSRRRLRVRLIKVAVPGEVQHVRIGRDRLLQLSDVAVRVGRDVQQWRVRRGCSDRRLLGRDIQWRVFATGAWRGKYRGHLDLTVGERGEADRIVRQRAAPHDRQLAIEREKSCRDQNVAVFGLWEVAELPRIARQLGGLEPQTEPESFVGAGQSLETVPEQRAYRRRKQARAEGSAERLDAGDRELARVEQAYLRAECVIDCARCGVRGIHRSFGRTKDANAEVLQRADVLVAGDFDVEVTVAHGVSPNAVGRRPSALHAQPILSPAVITLSMESEHSISSQRVLVDAAARNWTRPGWTVHFWTCRSLFQTGRGCH